MTKTVYYDLETAYDGACLDCRRPTPRVLSVGKGHWGYCSEHRVKWFIGSNLYSGWKDQSEEEQRSAYDAVGLGEFEDISLWAGGR